VITSAYIVIRANRPASTDTERVLHVPTW